MINSSLVIFLIFFIASTNVGAIKLTLGREIAGRIVGGRTVNITDFPYQSSVEHKEYHICGASIYSPSTAVTAGHCVVGLDPYYLRVRAGTANKGSGGTLHRASSVLIHPLYNQTSKDYDVAVIHVSTPFSNSTVVQPVPLAMNAPFPPVTGNVSGWGTVNFGGSSSSALRAVSIPIVSSSTCNTTYGGDITTRMICAGTKGQDSCFGDDGGPLVVGGRLAGVVSWSYGCAARYPGVYTNVANPDIYNFIVANG